MAVLYFFLLVARVDEVVGHLLDDVCSSTGLLGLVINSDEDGFVGLDGDASRTSLLAVHAPVISLQGKVLDASQVDAVRTDVGRVLVSPKEGLDLVGLYCKT